MEDEKNVTKWVRKELGFGPENKDAKIARSAEWKHKRIQRQYDEHGKAEFEFW